MLTLLYRLLRNLLLLPFAPLLLLARYLARPKAAWLHLKVAPIIVEVEPPERTFDPRRFLPRPRRSSLQQIRKLADRVSRATHVKGLVVEVPPLAAGWATVTGLRGALLKVREAGKEVVVWLPQGGGNRELWLSTAATRVLISPVASLGPLGLSAGGVYAKELLSKIGIEFEVEARHEFKTAAETVTRSAMSDRQREQVTALMDAIEAELLAGLDSRPGLEDAAAVLGQVILTGQACVDNGIADGLCYEEDIAPLVTGHTGKKAKMGGAGSFLAWHESRLFKPLRRQPYIAVIPVHGAITQAPKQGPLARRGPSADLESITGSIRAVAKDPRAVGVILHVDSPGGSALASDLIHQEVVALQRKKPVVACFGEVAASGGYYVAAPTDSIVAQPLTITGSIGVIMAKATAAELMAKVGVVIDRVVKHESADLLSPARKLTVSERALLAREADGFYMRFVNVVAKGRKRDFDVLEPFARGCVWSGMDALK
jgi:protease IV